MSALTVLDASAVLAFLQGEPGNEVVRLALQNEQCVVTAANEAEIISKALDKGISAEVVEGILRELGYEVIGVSPADGNLAGNIRTETRDIGLSLGDRICLACAKRLKAKVITADRPWLNVAARLELNILCIRPS